MTTPKNRVQELLVDHPTPELFAERYLHYVGELLRAISPAEVGVFLSVLLTARTEGRRVFFIGNGGSASTASHFANDLAIGMRSWHKPLQAISLTDNLSVLTAIANDYGYAHVFTRQLMVLMQPGDAVVAISASGNSPNLLEAIEYANAHGGVTVGLTGFDGGALRALVHHPVHVPTRAGEYGPVEDIHLIIDHMTTSYLRMKLGGA